VLDPDGHCLQLYFAMQQVVSDAPRRPPPGPLETWPERIEDRPEAFRGEPFLGPWG
jgi:hypothetical protein